MIAHREATENGANTRFAPTGDAEQCLNVMWFDLEKLKGRQSRIREKLTAFEERYNMKTEEFYRKFQEGHLGDETDFLEWSALADMHKEISQQLVEAERASNASPNPGAAQ